MKGQVRRRGKRNSQPPRPLVCGVAVGVVADCYSFSTSKKRNRVSGWGLQGLSKWNVTKRAAIIKNKKKIVQGFSL